MIDPQTLTLHVLDEARFFGGRMRYDDEATEMAPEERFTKLKAMCPLPEEAQIAPVLEETFWSSLLSEEGRPCRPRLLYVPRHESMRQAIHRLAKPVALTRENLRKLTPSQGPLGYLVWDCASDTAEITGIQGREGGDPPDFTIIAPNTGALDISWSCIRLLTLRAGRIERFSRIMLPRRHDALEIVRKLTGDFEPVLLNRTIQAIEAGGHGGALWILPEGRAPDGIHIGNPIQRDDRPLPQSRQARFPFLASIGYLAATDGAVLLDSRVRVLGFGAFIDIPDRDQLVVSIDDDGNAKQIASTKLGGGRHRSAVAFCVRFAPAAAIVVSEDGRISVMWAQTSDAPCFAPFSTLRRESE
jgi:hypothetical protein